MSHTPGPWEARYLEADSYLIKHSGYEIRTTAWDVATWIERGAPIRREADARLIAAAPDLLAACEAALEWFQYEVDHFDAASSPPEQILKAAIAKAKEESCHSYTPSTD